jgi:hypothetical protein
MSPLLLGNAPKEPDPAVPAQLVLVDAIMIDSSGQRVWMYLMYPGTDKRRLVPYEVYWKFVYEVSAAIKDCLPQL